MLDKTNNIYAATSTSTATDMDYDVPPFTRSSRLKKKMYAKAMYDNVADTPDELPFRKGEVLTVIEQDTDGCQGWWLCQLRGRQGLCPGNRLRLITSYDSGCFSPSPASSPCPSLAESSATLNSSICSAEIYENSSMISGTGSMNGSGMSASQTQLNQSKRRSWYTSPNKVVTPLRHGDVYVYNCPPTNKSHSSQYYTNPSQQQQYMQQQIYSNQSIYQNISVMSTPNGCNEFETYDIPKPATPVNYDCPKNLCRTPTSSIAGYFRTDTMAMSNLRNSTNTNTNTAPVQEDSYDVPRPISSAMHQENIMTPSTSNSSLLTCDCSFSSSSNRSSMANMPDYDVPRRNPLPVRALHQAAVSAGLPHQPLVANGQHHPQNQLHFVNGNGMSYNFPLSSSQSSSLQQNRAPPSLLATAASKELPLELCSALDTLAKLQAEATSAITRLLSFVSPNWRVREKLEPIVMEVKLAVVRLRAALHDLTEFGEGALGNATRSEDRTLPLKLRPLVKALRDADKLIHDSAETLDAQGGWTLEKLVRSEDKSIMKPPDSLDQLIACAQTLIEDVRQTTSFIQGNASLLFKRNVPNAVTAAANAEASNRSSAELVENYDYVCFESKDMTAKKNSALREAIPQNLQKKFDNVIKAAEMTAIAEAQRNDLTDKDKLLVKYYAVQITTHMGNLRQAIDSFLETVEKNQPPKFFIAYGKFVVVSAHNLITIGDIVHRNVSKADLKQKILRCTDALSEALKGCVIKSKKAAAHFPSVTAVQEMVDSVVDISHLASDLKTAMLQAVQLAF